MWLRARRPSQEPRPAGAGPPVPDVRPVAHVVAAVGVEDIGVKHRASQLRVPLRLAILPHGVVPSGSWTSTATC